MPEKGGGGSGGKGGSGGTGGKGGTWANTLKRRRAESLEETEARLLKQRTGKQAAWAVLSAEQKAAIAEKKAEWRAKRRPEEDEAKLTARREQRGGALSAQSATHLLLAKLFPLDDLILHHQKLEIEKFLDAVQVTSQELASQNKVVTAQIQFVQPGIAEVLNETDNTVWRAQLSAWSQECGVTRRSQIRFTHVHSVSANHAHVLETHAQKYMINLTSYDLDGKIGLFFSAAAVSPKGMSVLTVGNMVSVVPHVLVVILTVWFKNLNLKGIPAPSAGRTDKVFGPNPYAVSFVVCSC